MFISKSPRKKTKLEDLTSDNKKNIEAMFHDGYGPQTIAIRLRLSSGLVERHLKSVGLTRTLAEAHKIKRKFPRGAIE